MKNRFLPNWRFLLALSAVVWLSSCGPSSSNDPQKIDTPDAGEACSDSSCFPGTCGNGKSTIITGRVLAPNGVDPIPNAQVYIPRQLDPVPTTIECQICESVVESALAWTTTRVDGTFTLGPIPHLDDAASGTTVQLVTQKGRFRKVTNYPLQTPCDTNTINEAGTMLPARNSGDDRVPNIAVASGNYDKMECVLLNMGLAAESIHMFDGIGRGGTPNAEGTLDVLLTDATRMEDYDIIFINCSNNQFESLLQNPVVRTNIEQYAASGGRLYVTDWSYDFIEQIPQFSGMMDFAPTESGDSPEEPNYAQTGDGGITTEGIVHDSTLESWLLAVEELTGEEIISAGRVHIEHFLGQWAMQLSAREADNVKVWISGDVSGAGLSGEYPLTTTFDHNECGRVLYSSYHTEGRSSSLDTPFPNYCDAGATLSPQERVLMYLIMHVADCIDVVID